MKKIYTLIFTFTLFLLLPSSLSAEQCVKLTRDIYFNSTDKNSSGEVTKLQKFLRDEGILKAKITGEFDTATFRALKNFQTKKGVAPKKDRLGRVGEATRAAIVESSCGATSISSLKKKVVSAPKKTSVKAEPISIVLKSTKWNSPSDIKVTVKGIKKGNYDVAISSEEMGQLIIDSFDIAPNKEFTISIPDLDSGQYALEILQNEKIIAKKTKIIVERIDIGVIPAEEIVQETVEEPAVNVVAKPSKPAKIEIIYPNGTEFFNTGVKILARWKTIDYAADEYVNIYIFKFNPDNTESEISNINTENDGKQDIFLPEEEGTYFMRMTCFDAEGSNKGVSASGCRSDDSDGYFNVSLPPESVNLENGVLNGLDREIDDSVIYPRGSMSITFPKGGEIFKVGDNLDITWNLKDIAGIRKLAITSSDGFEQTIVNKETGNPVIAGTHYVTKLTDFGEGPYVIEAVMEDKNGDLIEASSQSFSIAKPASQVEIVQKAIEVTSAKTYTEVRNGYPITFTWTSQGIEKVNIYLYVDSTLDRTIASNVLNKGSYTWTPSYLSSNKAYYVRVKDAASDLWDVSDGYMYVNAYPSWQSSAAIESFFSSLNFLLQKYLSL